MVFEDVYIEFDRWIKEEVGFDKRFLFVTCGDWDLKTMLPNQCSIVDVPVPKYCKEWLNIKKVQLKFEHFFPEISRVRLKCEISSRR